MARSIRRAGEAGGIHAPELRGARSRSGLVTPLVVALNDPLAAEPTLVGNKAAALARAAAAGLPVLDGFVITTRAAEIDLTASPQPSWESLRPWWEELTNKGTGEVVVRSSSTSEDSDESSMAGRFTSVIDVRTWEQFAAAVNEVLASGGHVEDSGPMAVLVQRHVHAVRGGVMFTIDPVTGGQTTVVEVVDGGPHTLVDGTATSTRYRLRRRGGVIDVDRPPGGARLQRRFRRRLAALGRTVARRAGSPQDIEWAVDAEGALWLLQHRPITATGRLPQPGSPVLGPGPVAETLPDRLRPLEIDLWVAPLDQAVRAALGILGTAPPGALDRPGAVRAVGGWAVADLELLGIRAPRHRLLRRLDLRPPARRLAAAWRVGRLRRALPALADDVLARTDAMLAATPHPRDLSDAELVGLLHRGRRVLVSLHGHEVLAGILLDDDGAGSGPATGAGAALAALAEARTALGEQGDAAVVAARPEVLALTAPRIGAAPPLPAAPEAPTTGSRLADLGPREALRLRARWLQELTAVAATEAGRRLARRGGTDAADVALLQLHEVGPALAGGAMPGGLHDRCLDTAPPPAAFRLTADGDPVPISSADGGGGRPAGGGRGEGVVHHGGTALPPNGAVLVVRSLTPDLAPLLPRLGGLVAETGSALSHLAILARELNVPTVVGVAGALDRFPAGTRVLVDGTTGAVEATSRPAEVAAP